MNNRRKPKGSSYTDHIVSKTKRYGIGVDDREYCGTGFVIVPGDVSRDSYIKMSYQIGECMIITYEGVIIDNVKIPKHIIRDIVFPNDEEERGSLVAWQNIPQVNQVIITGILSKYDEMYGYREWEKVEVFEDLDSGNVIAETKDYFNGNYILDIIYSSESTQELTSGAIFRARSDNGQSKLTLLVNGHAVLYGDEVSKLQSEEQVEIQVGSVEGEDETEITKLTINRDGTFEYLDRYNNSIKIDGESGEMIVRPVNKLTIDGDKEIKIGEDAKESGTLGDTLVSILGEIIDAINQIVVPTGVGPSGVPVNAPVFASIKAKLNTIKSELVKIE